MLISPRRGFVFLSMPKCASTSIEEALAPHCGVVIRDPPTLKHASYTAFSRFYAPILSKKGGMERDEYEVVCIFREPVSWLNSWYRYRARAGLSRRAPKAATRYTGEKTFSDFLEAYLQDPQPPFAKVGDPYAFVSNRHGKVGVDKIFKYENLDDFTAYAAKKLKTEIVLPKMNVSPPGGLDVSAPLLNRVRERLSDAIKLYESL